MLRSLHFLGYAIALPAALLCGWHATQSLPPNELRTLLGRDVSFVLPGDKAPLLSGIPAALTWAVTWLSDMVTYATDRSGVWSVTARDVAIGVVLLISANIVGYLRQDRRNVAARLGILAWSVLVGLTLVDLYAFAEMPAFWRFPKGGEWPPGAYLRLAEMACLGVVAGTISTIVYNRTRLELFQPLSRIMFPVWFGLTWRGALFVYALPWLLGLVTSIRAQYLRHPTGTIDLAIGYAAIAGIAFVAWLVVGRGALRKLGDVGRIIHIMILLRGPLPRDEAAQGFSPYAQLRPGVGWP